MVVEGIMPLMQSGAINNSRKGFLDGVTAAGMVAGSPAFRTFVERNDHFLVIPAAVSHGVEVLMRLNAFTSVNSAIEVDLTGQVNAEYLHEAQFSGVGGQADYAFAGSTSPMPGSRSIIVLPSSTSDGTRSRIVPTLSEGAIVTSPRYCVDHVVTEWGVADLRSRTLSERAAALINIAHPAHREALLRAATRR
jgi:acyl-CoA hydrolase